MKKILLGILALAAVACNNDVVVNEQTSSEITFGDSFVEVKTRGAEDPSTTTATINAFDVWGFMDKTSGTVFNQERVTRDANGWSYDNIQWWFPSKEYYFYAVSPVDDSNIVVNTDAMNTDGLGNIAFTNFNGTTDLLYASKSVETDDTDPYFEDSNTGDKVSLQFMHLLSKIKFTFTNGFPNENTTLKVTNIKIVDAPAKGDVDVNIESRLDYAWNLVQGETTTLEFGNVNGGQPLASAESQECDFERLTIPADASRTYTIEFDLEIFTGTESGLTSHKVVTLENQAFAIGKNYNIVAVINDENFAEEALRPIEFDVVVEEWLENNFNGNLDYDSNQQPVALAAPAVTADVAVNVVTLTWDAIEGASHYTVQVDDDVEEVVNATSYIFTGDYEVEYMFTVKAIAADTAKNADSEATVVKATTEAEPQPAEPVVLYLNPTMWNVDGARYAAYMWNDAGNIWVDLTLAAGETDIYEFTAPNGYSNLIFCRMNPSGGNNWENKWNQTKDLTVPTDGNNLFTITGWDDSDNSNWTVYTPTPAPVVPTYTSVAEFLAAAEDESATAPMYTLKGTITAVANTSYGNFDLTDDTGTVYIYGLCSPDGATQKYWATSGAKLGDDIVIKTVRTSFNGSAQGKNAWFVELVSPGTRAFYTVDPAAVDFVSAGGEQDIEVFAYNTTAAVTATSDNSAFTVAINGYVVTVTAAANELEEEVTGNITIKVGDLESTVVKATLAAKPASGQVEGGSDDFHTISATNTSYVTGKTTAGWNYKNCAIFKGGTSDASPAFKMIGDANNRALCMNGKTSAVGSITSPTLTTGCGTLKFNYGLPFSDTQMKFRVDIMQDGEVVKTFTINNSSATKLTKYSHEENINVAGDFQIVFTNLSPSNSTSNKDRTAIWDVEWTGYNN